MLQNVGAGLILALVMFKDCSDVVCTIEITGIAVT